MLNLKRIKPLVIPLMLCLILVTVVSGASPIYKTNQWNDTNAMLQWVEVYCKAQFQ